MEITEEQRYWLGVALNEATVLGVEVDLDRCLGTATFCVLTLPETGPMPEDSRVQFRLYGVGRVAARLLESIPGIKLFSIQELLTVVQSFGGDCIYGWDFIDSPDFGTMEWLQSLSLDWRSEKGETAHSLCILLGGEERCLNLCIWFGMLEIFDPAGNQILLDDFIAGGKRWWDAFYAKDERTQGIGMFPL